jgi:tetratricopeptide (TPR) repeat protein
MPVVNVGEILGLALRHMQAGNVQQAESLLRQIIDEVPSQPDAYHLLGIIAYQAGRYDEAVAAIRHAVSLNPGAADFHTNLGLALQAVGRVDEAVAHYLHALRIQPASPETIICYGNILLGQKKLAEAEACYRRALQIKPGLASAHNGLGLALEQQDKLDQARACFRQAVSSKPSLAEAHYNLGNSYKRLEIFDEAIRCYEEALRLKPNLAEAANNLGGVLARQGKYDEAIRWYREALRINGNLADAYSGLGHAFERQDKPEEAVECYRNALRLQPGSVEARLGLGCALERYNRVDEAVECFDEILRLNPEKAEALNNLGTALERQEKLNEALTKYERAMQLKPGYAAARWNRARLLLLLGDFERGWPEYEGRWTQGCTVRREFHQPLWDGSDLSGRTILLYAEQGLGDTLQFCRYAQLVKQRGANVIVECQPQLIALLSSLRGIDHLAAAGSQLPAFDVQAPLGSLPGILGTTLETIPADVPYLRAASRLIAHWRGELSEVRCPTSDVGNRMSEIRRQVDFDIGLRTSDFGRSFRIGIAWQGNPAYGFDRQRSIPLKCFAPLVDSVEGIQLISLQKGAGRGQLKEMSGVRSPVSGVSSNSYDTGRRTPDTGHVFDPSDTIDEASGAFMDTAAIMKCIDLVISSDSAIAHLAGGLGVPAWIALPLIPDWRWLLRRENSPWYPGMRLFRQRRDGDWEEVFARMAEELKRRVCLAGAFNGS